MTSNTLFHCPILERRWGRLLIKAACSLLLGIADQNIVFSADEWYKSKEWVNRDPYSFSLTYRNYLFPQTGYNLQGRPATGYIYAVVPQKYCDELMAQPNHAKVARTRTLNSDKDVKTFREYFQEKGSGPQMPYYIGAVGLIPLRVTTAVGGAATFIDVLLQLADSPQRRTKAAELASTIALGGTFQEVDIVTKGAENRQFLSVNLVYNIKVGQEDRSIVISSATYAMKCE